MFRPPVVSIDCTLPTVNVDSDGNLRPTKRKTFLDVVEVQEGETPTIYELGIPVVPHDGKYHLNVAQKVLLNKDRDNVSPSYLRLLRGAHAQQHLPGPDARRRKVGLDYRRPAQR